MMSLTVSAMGQQVVFEADGIAYGVTSEQTVEVLPKYYFYNSPYSGALSIPQTVEHDGATYTVTALAASAFESCTTVTSLTLPPTIRTIGSYCFYDCRFSTLLLPDSLRVIEDHAFLYANVTSLHLPACFEEYGECAFWLRNLASITVDEGNTRYRSIDGWLYSKVTEFDLNSSIVNLTATGTMRDCNELITNGNEVTYPITIQLHDWFQVVNYPTDATRQ